MHIAFVLDGPAAFRMFGVPREVFIGSHPSAYITARQAVYYEDVLVAARQGRSLRRRALNVGQGGAPLDYVSAHMLFNLAAMRGSAEAKIYRRELSREMDQDEVAEAQRQARRWLGEG